MISQKLDEEAIFKIACRIDDADARADYLQQVCGHDDFLKTRLEELLSVYLQEPDYLESSQSPTANGVYLADIPQVIGSAIGPYTLRERIGEGGMGEVYVAERTEGVRHKVALKIIKPGMATKDVVARFEAERQALAMMDHPNISRVFDGGATEFGQPYFVMELVQGLSITEYCDAKRLDTYQRLLLFTKICVAVHHAHQKGIIHRDIKPSNILVPEIDGVAVPKVIDFGVAKAINQDLTEQTLYTHSSQMVGTPLYMSPEQAGLGVIDIDTRSDIYALGVLLYELIAGSTPFDREQLKSAGFDEMRRIIREDDPIKPSAKVETLKADSQSTVCQRRATDPRTLCKMLKGELDWMVMKAMDKDRNRRYESANDLAEDVHRYLRNEVVVAKPATRWYRIRKFSQRNRVLVASLSAVFLALSVGASLATIAFLHADQARDATNLALTEITHEQENNRELIKLLRKFFPGKWGMKTLERNRTVYESMEDISKTLATDLEGYPEVEVQVRKIFANSYMAAGAYNKAREHLYAALELSDAIHQGQPHETTAEIHAKLADEVGWNYDVSLDFHRLLRHSEKAIAMYEHLGVESGGYRMALFAKGQCLLAIYPVREAEAEQAQRRNVEIAKRAGNQPIIAIGDLGLTLMNLGEDRLEDAELVLEEAVEICRSHESESIKLPMTLSWRGRCLQLKGDLAAAIKVYEEAWQLFQADELRNEGRHSAGYRLVEAYFAQGELGQAFELIDELEQRLTAESSASLAECLFVKGWLHYQLENYGQAKEAFERSAKLAAEYFGNRDAKYIWPHGYLALTLEALGDKDAAANQFRTLLASTHAFVQAMSPSHDHDIFHWLHVRALIGSTSKDDPRLRAALEIAEKRIQFAQQSWSCKSPAYHKAVAEIRLRLEEQAAISSLVDGLNKAIEPHATFRSVSCMVPTRRCDLEIMLAQLHVENGNVEGASNVLEHAVHLREDALGVDHIQTAMAQLRLGKFLVEHSGHVKIDAAKEHLHAAYKKLKSHPAAVNRLRQQAADKLAQVYQAEGDLEHAASWQAKSAAHSGAESESCVEQQQHTEEHGRRA